MGLLPVKSSSGTGSSSSGTGANGTDSVDGASSAGSGNGQGGGDTQPTFIRLRGGPCMVQAGGTVSFGDESATGSSCPCDLPAAVMRPAEPVYDPPDLLEAAIDELEQVAQALADDLAKLDTQAAASGLKN